MPSQTLKYIVDADASGAIRGFKQVGSTAKSELDLASSKTQTTSEKWTSFGKTALVAGAVVGGALYKVGGRTRRISPRRCRRRAWCSATSLAR